MKYKVRFMVDWYTTHLGPIEVVAPNRELAVEAARLLIDEHIQSVEPSGFEVEHEVVTEHESEFNDAWWCMDL